jgi:ribosomal RNA-processing protein 9
MPTMAGDPFLADPSRKRKRARPERPQRPQRPLRPAPRTAGNGAAPHDEEISSTDDEPGAAGGAASGDESAAALSLDDEFEGETAADKRRRLAKQYLDNLKNDEFFDAAADFDAQDLDDDIVARRLQTDVAEQKGYVYRFLGEKVAALATRGGAGGAARLEVSPTATRIGLRNLTAMSVRMPHLYTVSKDCELIKWRVEPGKRAARVKHTRGGLRFAAVRAEQHRNHHCDAILCVAASPDGKHVVTGGADGRVIIWSLENLACLRVLEARAAVNQIVFRRGSDQLYAACADLRVRTYLINQHAQLEVLYGHQDTISDIASLSRETCVLVGLRDKTAMFWKIAEELRLTFRGGDAEKRRPREAPADDAEDAVPFVAEGSIECVLMVDELHFVTGSDNGNVALWLLAKKKPLCTVRAAHGFCAAAPPARASAETLAAAAARQVPPRLPHWITAIHAVPFSDLFVTGSYDGALRVWRIAAEGLRQFALVGEVQGVHGCIVLIRDADVAAGRLTVFALASKEHKFGRWLGKIEGARNALVAFTIDV